MQREKQAQQQSQTQQEHGSLEEQDNLLIEMLQSDKIIDIGIFVCFLGVLILGFCCYLLQGHLRFHLGVILFLMLGLGGSLMIYKCLNSTKEAQNDETQKSEQEDSSKEISKQNRISEQSQSKSKKNQ